MPKPNFFIVGAPKSGTTAMNQYLSEHPDIFMARKEMHYFGSDLKFIQRPTGFKRVYSEDEYLREFETWSDEARVGEASVLYLCSTQAAHEIKAFSPDAKIIIMLRDPVEAMYSHFYQARFSGSEHFREFQSGLAAEPDRKRGEKISSKTRMVSELFYRENVQYAEQVERYFDVFGRENVHVIIYDDFKANTADSYHKTLEFLDVDSNFQTEFPIVNANKVVRSQFFRRFFRNPPLWYKALLLPGKILIPQRIRDNVNKRVVSNIVQQKLREQMDPILRQQLNEEMRPKVEKLGELIGRDLSHWCRN